MAENTKTVTVIFGSSRVTRDLDNVFTVNDVLNHPDIKQDRKLQFGDNYEVKTPGCEQPLTLASAVVSGQTLMVVQSEQKKGN